MLGCMNNSSAVELVGQRAGNRMSIVKRFVPSFLTSLLVGFMSSTGASSAEFRIIPPSVDSAKRNLVTVEGIIERGDAARFDEAVRTAITSSPFERLVIALNSPGGNVGEAMKMGETIRAVLAATTTFGADVWLPEHSSRGPILGGLATFLVEYIHLGEPLPELPKCWSACTLLFVSGVVHLPRDNTDMRSEGNIIRIPTIGVHRPAFVGDMFGRLPPREAQRAYTRMLDEMAEFLSSMGATEEFVRLSMSTPASQIELIPSSKMSEFVAVPFYEEWLSARCPVDYSSFTEEELQIEQKIYKMYESEYDEILRWDQISPRPRTIDVRLVEEFGLQGAIEARAIEARVDKAREAAELCAFLEIVKVRRDWVQNRSGAIAQPDKTERSRSDEK